jgi:heme-degrading monooxygenase HmoA
VSVRFALEVRLKPGREGDLRAGYGKLRDRLEGGVDGLIVHQLCEAQGDDRRWLITSEWRDAESNRAWESSDEHRALTMPLRDCWEEAKLSHYEVQSEFRAS